MSSTESQTAFIVSWMSSFYNLVRLVSGLQQIPLLVNCLICLGLRMAVKWGKASVDKEVLPDSSGRTDTGDQNFNLVSLPEIVLNQIYFFKYGYVCLCLIISYLPGSILSAHRNQCELWAQWDCPIITLKINLFPLGIHGQHCVLELQRPPALLLRKKKRERGLKISVVRDNPAILLELSSAV